MGRTFLALVALIVLLRAAPVADVDAATPRVAEKRIAFTFDDAPRGPGAFLDPKVRTVRLIDALRRAGVKQAAFFVNPGRITRSSGFESRISAYVAAGHVIGDHSFSHGHLSGESAEAYLADIDKAEDWLRGRDGYRPWYRFPFLDEGGRDKAKRDAVRKGLHDRGLMNAYVTAEGLDWNLEERAIEAKRAGEPIDMAALRDLYVETHVQAADFADKLMRRTLGRAPPQVMLMHETDLAALFIGDLVAALKAHGWQIVTADQAYADPIHLTEPDTPVAAGTRAEALAWQKGVTGRFYDRAERPVSDALFAERVLHQRKS